MDTQREAALASASVLDVPHAGVRFASLDVYGKRLAICFIGERIRHYRDPTMLRISLGLDFNFVWEGLQRTITAVVSAIVAWLFSRRLRISQYDFRFSIAQLCAHEELADSIDDALKIEAYILDLCAREPNRLHGQSISTNPHSASLMTLIQYSRMTIFDALVCRCLCFCAGDLLII